MYIKPDYKNLKEIMESQELKGIKIENSQLVFEVSKNGNKASERIYLGYTVIKTDKGKIYGDELVGFFRDPSDYFRRVIEVEGIDRDISRIAEGRPKYDGSSFGGGIGGVFC